MDEAYVPLGDVLILGDGDFSFARALAFRRRLIRVEDTRFIHATVFMKYESSLINEYASAEECIRELQEFPNVVLSYAVDATLLPHTLPGPGPDCPWSRKGLQRVARYDAVIFNFPHDVSAKLASASRACASADTVVAYI
jgi:hypothetical protein